MEYDYSKQDSIEEKIEEVIRISNECYNLYKKTKPYSHYNEYYHIYSIGDVLKSGLIKIVFKEKFGIYSFNKMLKDTEMNINTCDHFMKKDVSYLSQLENTYVNCSELSQKIYALFDCMKELKTAYEDMEKYLKSLISEEKTDNKDTKIADNSIEKLQNELNYLLERIKNNGYEVSSDFIISENTEK